MSKVFEYIWEYRFLIMLLAWGVTYAITSWTNFKLDVQKGIIASKQMAKEQVLKNGQEQAEWVLNYVLQKLPKAWVAFLGEERTRQLIQKLYNSALDLIDDGKLNESIGK